MNNRFAATNAARTLKVAGIILILSFFIDFLVLLFPFQPTNKDWQIALATALVDRGIVPMVGLGMLMAGYWIDTVDDGGRPNSFDLRFPALILSTILGFLFLVIAPIHALNIVHQRTLAVDQITQNADQAENELKNQTSQLQAQLNNQQVKAAVEKQRSQIKAQFTSILSDDTRYKQALASQSVSPQEKELLKKFKANPKELDTFLAQQSDPQQLADQKLSLIRNRRQELEKQAQQAAYQSGVRISLGSFLLAIGYIIIGWTGLRTMGALQGGGRKVAAR